MLLRDLEGGPPWVPEIPQVVYDSDGIPSDAFEAMTNVGAANNPHLLLSARMIDNYYWEPIPEIVELLPNEQRVPIANDPRFPF